LGNKLAQVVSGFLYYDDGTVDRFDEARLQVLDEIIAEADGPVLLWYWFAETGAALRERYRAPQLLDVLEEWRRGEVPVAVCHPRSGGHGVNAQADNAIMVWVEHTWSDEERAQAEARLHRQGQRTAVRIYSLMARVEGVESIDHTMRKKREGKRSMADAVTDHLKTTTAAVANDGGVPANPTEG
jgi:hypothetical protein